MEIPTLEDFRRFENHINSKMEEILRKLSELTQQPVFSKILHVKDVEEEYKQSPYNQRNARQQGKLPYTKIGKDITYNRNDVESWVNSTKHRIA